MFKMGLNLAVGRICCHSLAADWPIRLGENIRGPSS